MAKSHHLSRKELKEDAVKNIGVSIYEYIQENAHQVLTGALAVVAIVLLVVAVNKFSASRAEKAAEQLNSIQKQYLNALSTTDPTARTAALDEAAATCDSVAKSYGSSEVGHEALFIKANCLYLQESYDEAVKVFEQYQGKVSGNDDRAKALVAIGYCYEDKAFTQQNDKALLAKAKEVFEKAAQMSNLSNGKGSYQKYQAQLGVVRVEIALGNLAEAKKLAEAVKQERIDEPGKDKSKDEDMSGWARMNRADKSRLIRKSLVEARAGLNFEKRAEGDLEEIEARLKLPAGAAAASLPVARADAVSTKTAAVK